MATENRCQAITASTTRRCQFRCSRVFCGHHTGWTGDRVSKSKAKSQSKAKTRSSGTTKNAEIQFIRAKSAALLKHAAGRNTYAGSTTNISIEAYINPKRIGDYRVKGWFTKCYYRSTTNIRSAEDALLAHEPDFVIHLRSGVQDVSGFVYVLKV